MTRDQLLSNIWIRVLVFAWMIVFPVIFVVLPAFEMFTGETEISLTPLWAFIVWITGPWAVSVLLKYFGGSAANSE